MPAPEMLPGDPGGRDEPPSAVLAIMRMARALERVDTGLSPQQCRILKLAATLAPAAGRS